MATLTSEEVISTKYLARVSFKHNGVKYKSFDEIDPKAEGWKAREVADLVRAGRIMPFDPDKLDNEVFYEISYLTRRSPLGICAAEMRDVISTGKIDEAADGKPYTEIPAMVAVFSTYCINQFGEKVPTTAMSVIPEDRHVLAVNGEKSEESGSEGGDSDSEGG